MIRDGVWVVCVCVNWGRPWSPELVCPPEVRLVGSNLPLKEVSPIVLVCEHQLCWGGCFLGGGGVLAKHRHILVELV